jgi:ABC-type multidrug transport system ATPase subunit
LAIALSSQHLHEVERISDNIIFIKNGEALYNGAMRAFAADRTENLYELHTPADLAQLQQVFAEMPNIAFEASHAAILLRTPVDVASFHLLEILARHQITITYFRDISTSTSRLFR